MSSAIEQGLFTVIEILAIGFGLHLLWKKGFPRIVRFNKYLYFRVRGEQRGNFVEKYNIAMDANDLSERFIESDRVIHTPADSS